MHPLSAALNRILCLLQYARPIGALLKWLLRDRLFYFQYQFLFCLFSVNYKIQNQNIILFYIEQLYERIYCYKLNWFNL